MRAASQNGLALRGVWVATTLIRRPGDRWYTPQVLDDGLAGEMRIVQFSNTDLRKIKDNPALAQHGGSKDRSRLAPSIHWPTLP
jgi:hypothetical protein